MLDDMYETKIFYPFVLLFFVCGGRTCGVERGVGLLNFQ